MALPHQSTLTARRVRLSEGTVLGLVAIFALGVTFDYINGFHDTANAIATSVSTRALKPEYAIVLSATANLLGAIVLGTAVAGTIGSGIVQDKMILGNGSIVLIAALVGAIAWDLITWLLAIPSSSSHALIGGLIGAAWAAAGLNAVQWGNFVGKVVFPLVSSPILGVVIGFAAMVALLNLIGRARLYRIANLVRPGSSNSGATPAGSSGDAGSWSPDGVAPRKINDRFRRLQILSATYMALSHGSNDAQKTMGIMTLALANAGAITADAHGKVPVPTWVIILCATAMAFGTAAGGWRIMKTMGQRVVKLDPVHGFAAETTAASIILGASQLGMPVSTTHVISSAIMGAGASDRPKTVRWELAGNIVTTWILTIPCAAVIAGAGYYMLQLLSGPVGGVLKIFGV